MTPGANQFTRGQASPTNPPPANGPGGHRGGAAPGLRRGVRTVVLSVVGVVGLAALAVWVLIGSLGPPEGTPPGPRTGGEASGSGTGSAPAGVEGPAIAGTVSISQELAGRLSEGDTLFIIARKGPGAPFAVRRIAGPRFPLAYRMGPEDAMVAGTPFEGEVTVSARLSKAGSAGPAQPGDMEGEHPRRVAIGARGVDIVIARVR